MKKSINSLVPKAQASAGHMQGGFGLIRGGMSSLYIAENSANCTNSGTCGGTNDVICTNSGICTSATNKTASSCINSGTCPKS